MATDSKIHALVVTGGHGFEEQPFWEMFNSFENFSYDTVVFPEAFNYLNIEAAESYDVLVFYDMWQEINTDQQMVYLELLNHGKPIVYLHHALISFQEWDEFNQIVGGVWEEGKGTVKHNVHYTIQIADPSHPVTQGMQDFEIEDETYANYSVNPNVHVLLTAEHPESAPVIGWTHRYENSQVVYIQLGHDGLAYGNSGYRKLVDHAIRWVVDTVDEGSRSYEESAEW